MQVVLQPAPRCASSRSRSTLPQGPIGYVAGLGRHHRRRPRARRARRAGARRRDAAQRRPRRASPRSSSASAPTTRAPSCARRARAADALRRGRRHAGRAVQHQQSLRAARPADRAVSVRRSAAIASPTRRAAMEPVDPEQSAAAARRTAIGPADFDGWVQERGLYYAATWDDRYTPLFRAADPGEAPLLGGLLVARHGRGRYVYTGLAFFRQLPAGVPGRVSAVRQSARRRGRPAVIGSQPVETMREPGAPSPPAVDRRRTSRRRCSDRGARLCRRARRACRPGRALLRP